MGFLLVGLLLAFPLVGHLRYSPGETKRLLITLGWALLASTLLLVIQVDQWYRDTILELILNAVLWSLPFLAVTLAIIMSQRDFASTIGRLALTYFVLLIAIVTSVLIYVPACATLLRDASVMP